MKSFSPKAQHPKGSTEKHAHNDGAKAPNQSSEQQSPGLEWSFRNIGIGGPPPAVSISALSQPAFQPKLAVNEAGDQYEQEADRVAEQVMRMPEPGIPQAKSSLRAVPLVQRKCAQCEEEEKLQRKCAKCEEEEKLQRKETSGSSQPGVAPAIVHEVLNSSGQPLDSATRAFFEPRFGYTFSKVRIHTDRQAAEAAQSVKALAYTVGSHIFFDDNQYASSIASGGRLLAHEL